MINLLKAQRLVSTTPLVRFQLLHEQQDQLHDSNDDFEDQFDNGQVLNHHVISSRERIAACQASSSISPNLTGSLSDSERLHSRLEL